MSDFFKKLKKALLYGSSFKLRPYEEAVLEGWRRHLTPEADALVAAQLQHLVCYQRQAEGRIVAFFPLGKETYPRLPEEVHFPSGITGTLARVHVNCKNKEGTEVTVRGEIQSHKGELVLIEYNKIPKDLGDEATVAKVELLNDPLSSAPRKDKLEDVGQIASKVLAKLPEEYLSLVGQNSHIQVNGWEVNTVAEVHKIPLKGGNYYILAFKEEFGAVGVKEDDWSGQLFFLPNESDAGEPITVGLREFLEKFDGGKVIGRF